MPRDIPVGNGQMLVTFDHYYRIRDLYFPHVGQENHVGGHVCRFGVWAPLPQTNHTIDDRRKRRLFWSDQGWEISLGYERDTLASQVVMHHPQLHLTLRCTDIIDFHEPLMIRQIEVENLTDHDRLVHLFHHNDFHMYGTKVGDTAYFDPQLHCLIHYRKKRYIMVGWYVDDVPRIDEYATGTAGFRGAEGTWRDAEDGQLGHNAIAQGAVDSTMMTRLDLSARAKGLAHLVIGAGQTYHDLEDLHGLLNRDGPSQVIDRTRSYWRLWLSASTTDFSVAHTEEDVRAAPSEQVTNLFKRSLLIVRTQIDHNGAIIAANDSDIMQYSRDTYSYLWPRDGALVAASLDATGFPDVARSFYTLCGRIIEPQGYFLHKYNPDGSPASSWHPWVNMGKPQLPIQEDETALVLWALWHHYDRYRDIEFISPLWANMIKPATDFLLRFRDPDTSLPLPSYDLWEERWGIHAFTVATVYGGLQAAANFARGFGDDPRTQACLSACEALREAFCKHFWSDEHDRFLRRIVPLDHERTADLMFQIMAGQTPTSVADTSESSDEARSKREVRFEYDSVIDSSMYAIFSMGLLDVHDPRVEKTMTCIENRLWVKTPVGGLARYEADPYHQISDHTDSIPGNPWFICTLWLAEWHIAKAKTVDDLTQALPIFDWVANHALESGVLAEQVDPNTNAPLSVSPLTWSHATVVSTLTAYMTKLAQMQACPTCGQSHQAA